MKLLKGICKPIAWKHRSRSAAIQRYVLLKIYVVCNSIKSFTIYIRKITTIIDHLEDLQLSCLWTIWNYIVCKSLQLCVHRTSLPLLSGCRYNIEWSILKNGHVQWSQKLTTSYIVNIDIVYLWGLWGGNMVLCMWHMLMVTFVQN